MRRGGGAGLAMRLGLEDASVDDLDGHANLMVQTRLGGSPVWVAGAGAGFAGASTGFLSSFGPHANMMHLFLPKTASMLCSVL